ncbi:MAG: dihydropteroate synthase [Prevotella sp.]|nr:dihydropteroate synthase [Prevotella sp.]
MNYQINIRGRLLNFNKPVVMGILNATPDSFYAASRKQDEQQIAERANEIVAQGATIIDVGACSTRPGSEPADEQTEMARLRQALAIVRREQPDAVVSVDTFRPNVAKMAVEEYGADIINDVSGLLNINLRVPYILMSTQGTLHDMLIFFAQRIQQLRDIGQKDIIIDPGFGFGKTLQQNYDLMAQMDRLNVLQLPILVGISRKSMIYKLLDITPNESLNATTALHAIALAKGASILRVHDVKEAVEVVEIMQQLRGDG